MRYVWALACAAAVIIAVGCGRQATSGVAVDSGFKSFVPSNAIALAGIDLESLKKTPLYQRHAAAFQAQVFDAMTERVGIDPRRDIARLLIAWNGKDALFVAEGRFPSDVISTKLTGLGAQRTLYQNYPLFKEANQGGRVSVAFLQNKLAVAGSVSAVHQAIDEHSSGSGSVPEALGENLAKLPKGDQIWEVSSGPLLENVPLRSDIQSALSNIASYVSRTRAGLVVDSGLRLDAEIACISEEGAQRVRDAIRGSIGLGRLATNNNNLDLLRLWDAIKVVQNGQIVDITADLPPDLTDKLIANAPKLKNRARDELPQR